MRNPLFKLVATTFLALSAVHPALSDEPKTNNSDTTPTQAVNQAGESADDLIEKLKKELGVAAKNAGEKAVSKATSVVGEALKGAVKDFDIGGFVTGTIAGNAKVVTDPKVHEAVLAGNRIFEEGFQKVSEKVEQNLQSINDAVKKTLENFYDLQRLPEKVRDIIVGKVNEVLGNLENVVKVSLEDIFNQDGNDFERFPAILEKYKEKDIAVKLFREANYFPILRDLVADTYKVVNKYLTDIGLPKVQNPLTTESNANVPSQCLAPSKPSVVESCFKALSYNEFARVINSKFELEQVAVIKSINDLYKSVDQNQIKTHNGVLLLQLQLNRLSHKLEQIEDAKNAALTQVRVLAKRRADAVYPGLMTTYRIGSTLDTLGYGLN